MGKLRLEFMISNNTLVEVLKYKPPGKSTPAFVEELIELALSKDLKN